MSDALYCGLTLKFWSCQNDPAKNYFEVLGLIYLNLKKKKKKKKNMVKSHIAKLVLWSFFLPKQNL